MKLFGYPVIHDAGYTGPPLNLETAPLIHAVHHPCANPGCKTCKGLGVLDLGWLYWTVVTFCPDCIELEPIDHSELGVSG